LRRAIVYCVIVSPGTGIKLPRDDFQVIRYVGIPGSGIRDPGSGMELAITRNASEALQIAQLGIELKAGDEVVTTIRTMAGCSPLGSARVATASE